MTYEIKTLNLSRRRILMGGGASCLLGCGNKVKTQSEKASLGGRPNKGWSSAPSLPEAVQEIYPCAHKGRIHQAGGFTAKDGRIVGPTAAHHMWRPGDGSWSEVRPIPTARHHPHLISFKGRLLAFAGFESTVSTPFAQGAWTIRNTGWVLDEDEGAWLDMPALPAPAAEAVVGVTGDGALHLAGGRTWAKDGVTGGWRDHIDTDHHFVLTDISGRWERAAPCLYKRNSAAGAIIDGQFHIVGGREVGGGNVAHHSVYDLRQIAGAKPRPCRKPKAASQRQVLAESSMRLAASFLIMAAAYIHKAGFMTRCVMSGTLCLICRTRVMV